MDDIQLVVQLPFPDDLVDVIDTTGKVIGHTHVRYLDMGAKGTLTYIEVDQDDLLVREGEAHRQIDGHERLAGSRIERGEHHHLHVLLLHPHEVHIGTHDTERLRNRVAAVLMHHHFVLVLLVAHRYLAQERHGEYPLHILPRAYLRIADHQQPQDTGRYRAS